MKKNGWTQQRDKENSEARKWIAGDESIVLRAAGKPLESLIHPPSFCMREGDGEPVGEKKV